MQFSFFRMGINYFSVCQNCVYQRRHACTLLRSGKIRRTTKVLREESGEVIGNSPSSGHPCVTRSVRLATSSSARPAASSSPFLAPTRQSAVPCSPADRLTQPIERRSCRSRQKKSRDSLPPGSLNSSYHHPPLHPQGETRVSRVAYAIFTSTAALTNCRSATSGCGSVARPHAKAFRRRRDQGRYRHKYRS